MSSMEKRLTEHFESKGYKVLYMDVDKGEGFFKNYNMVCGGFIDDTGKGRGFRYLINQRQSDDEVIEDIIKRNY